MKKTNEIYTMPFLILLALICTQPKAASRGEAGERHAEGEDAS
jgi:hypothetical protein